MDFICVLISNLSVLNFSSIEPLIASISEFRSNVRSLLVTISSSILFSFDIGLVAIRLLDSRLVPWAMGLV